MAKKKKRSWISRLFDMDDNTVSASTVFMVATSLVATVLLLVPAIVLIIEVVYNHTITTDLTGMGTYISAIVALYASGGLVKGWTNYSNYKFNQNNSNNNTTEEDEEELDA